MNIETLHLSISRGMVKFALFFSGVLISLSASAQKETRGEVPSFKMNGTVALLSNFVEHGLTQTNKDPTLQGAFGFNFGPQFRMGVWGSNVNYESTEHFLLKINAELKVQLSSESDFKLGYNSNRYFKSDLRNGSTTYLQLSVHGFRIRHETTGNWEGTDQKAKYYSFGKAFELSQSWIWDNEVGYTMVTDVIDIVNFFDARTSFQYTSSMNNITYQLTATGTSEARQFYGRGDVFVLAGASTTF